MSIFLMKFARLHDLCYVIPPSTLNAIFTQEKKKNENIAFESVRIVFRRIFVSF